MIRTAPRSFYTHQLTCDIFYRRFYGNFNDQQFLIDIQKKKINIRNQYPDSVFCDKLTKIFKGVTEKHAPLKKQKVPENNFGNKWEITFFKLIVGMMSEK